MYQPLRQPPSSFPAAPSAGPPVLFSAATADSFSSSSAGSISPSLSLRTPTIGDMDALSQLGLDQRTTERADSCATGPGSNSAINLQIFVPELQMQKCLSVLLDELVWDIKRRLLDSLPQQLPQFFNFGLFLPPCDGRAGKFLLEDRTIREYPFHDCVPYVELKYKKRVYKMLRLDEKALKAMHSKANLRKLTDAVQAKNAQKVERLCSQGLDPNFHDAQGETPMTLAAGVPANRDVLVQLIGGGAHLDYRNTEGQTGMHKAAFLSVADNVRALLELGASPNYKDLIGLTPLYYNMLSPESNPEVAEMLLAEAADLEVVDMHGNTALHQACKNGLAKHTEQLLFYGADINARNVNGNTPLHVCAVNGRVDCAQVLLYRGADPTQLNRQGQTAGNVAQIVGNLPVAEVIQGHSPHNVVPFREQPRLNPRRRMSSRQLIYQEGHQLMRRRSLSHCSSSSTLAQQSAIGPPNGGHIRFSATNGMVHPMAASPSPSMTSSATAAADYGTLRRIPADVMGQPQQPGAEPNVPRIMVIPRGPKGFGFILRGVRHVDSAQHEFRPTAANPALQFFEGVDMQGMAMRAGLRPGDFLLEINGVDVRAASHERVVQLIHQSGDTITLKVITVELADPPTPVHQPASAGMAGGHYASTGNYATVGRRNHSVPRAMSIGQQQQPVPPPPPQRNPATSLSFGRTFSNANGTAQFSATDFAPAQVHHRAPILPIPTGQHLAGPFGGGGQYGQLPPRPNGFAPSGPCSVAPAALGPQPHQHQLPVRCASVKMGRSSAVRRISAAELEHIMVVQQQQGSSQQSIQLGPEQHQQQQMVAIAQQQGAHRRLTMAEMKRRTQRALDESHYGAPPSLLKASSSSPDIAGAGEDQNGAQGQQRSRLVVLRPKTPPPPPPPAQQRPPARMMAEPPPMLGMGPGGGTQCAAGQQPPIYASTVVVPGPPSVAPPNAVAVVHGGPPAPPPPPPNLLLRPGQAVVSSSSSSAAVQQQQQQKPAGASKVTGGQSLEAGSADCRGVSAEALRSVRLKPVVARDEPAAQGTVIAQNKPVAKENISNNNKPKVPADFDSDLRSALAKRRSKVRGEETTQLAGVDSGTTTAGGSQGHQQQNGGAKTSTSAGPPIAASGGNPANTVMVGRYTGGLSLRESVLENVSGAAAKGGGQSGAAKGQPNSHSPPGGCFTKKDSGYTSSRTSLEPSECGDCEAAHQQSAGGQHPSSAASLPVNVLSQQLMDHQQQAQPPSLKPTGLLPGSKCPLPPSPSAAGVRIPPVDYDQQQTGSSGCGGSSSPSNCSSNDDSGTQRDCPAREPEEPTLPPQQAGPSSPSSAQQQQKGGGPLRSNSPNSSVQRRPRTGKYRQRPVADWDPEDVSEWLDELELGQEYWAAFSTVAGADLLRFDRARFTALGVTRIAHRQRMEQSLRALQQH